MHLVQFTCQGFRALQDLRFEPARGISVIRGANAQGKTSLLEAVLFTATARSHRTNLESDLVTAGQQWFRLSAEAARHDRNVTLEATWYDGVKRFRVNGVAQARISDILGKINVVLFSPEDIVLVKGTAAHRRRFLDMELSQVSPVYLNALQQYRQVMRQRNELLRAAMPDGAQLDAWDAQLIRYGTVLTQERDLFVSRLAGFAAEAYARIADGERLDLLYQPDVPTADRFAEVLAKSRTTDVRRGTTTRGPHRDDLDITVAGQPARAFASQGQQKTAALALKLAETALVNERAGEYPILMLDDVLSELDETRARRLFAAVDSGVQCLITTTVTREGGLFPPDCACYRIERGQLANEEA
jgi:DNA replication and repair protein RecF